MEADRALLVTAEHAALASQIAHLRQLTEAATIAPSYRAPVARPLNVTKVPSSGPSHGSRGARALAGRTIDSIEKIV